MQEHSVERLSGEPLSQGQVPAEWHIARNSSGAVASQPDQNAGLDTKLVGQMQPCYEALGLQRQRLGDISIPSLVSQIADGENGGVMMNEFPSASSRPIGSG